MAGVNKWGGTELLRKLEREGVVNKESASKLSGLHGVHDILRQSLASRAESRNAWEDGNNVVMTKNYHNHYKGFMNEVDKSMGDLQYSNEDVKEEPKFQEAKKIVGELREYLESCYIDSREDPATFFKKQYYVCPKTEDIKESDLIKLNRATSNVHRVWETNLAKSFKDSEIGDSPTPEQCMIVKIKDGKKTPTWAKEFCKPENFSNHKDLSALVLACPNKGAILMRRLDVSAGENEGLHSTQITIRPKEIRINPNVEGIEKDYNDVLEPLKAQKPKETKKNPNIQKEWRTIPVKSQKDLEDKVSHLGENINSLIRPNTNMPLIEHRLWREE